MLCVCGKPGFSYFKGRAWCIDCIKRKEDLDRYIETKTASLHNEIIHSQVQLRQAQQALDAARAEGFNAGVEASAQLTEANDLWFYEVPHFHEIVEKIRDLKE